MSAISEREKASKELESEIKNFFENHPEEEVIISKKYFADIHSYQSYSSFKGATLNEIVTYLKKNDESEINRGKDTIRAKRERVRRLLNKLPNIQQNGRTRDKKYVWGLPWAGLSETFISTEILGGFDEIEKVVDRIKLRSDTEESKEYNWGLGYHHNDEEKFTENVLNLIRNVLIDDFFGILPYEIVGNDRIKTYSKEWFSDSSVPWMPRKHFSFQAPSGLGDIIDNIGNMIKSTDINKIPKSYDVHEEIKWLKQKKQSKVKRLNNPTIITLALLHLNRSLQRQITDE